MTKPAWLAPWLAELGGKGKKSQRPSSPERERLQSAQGRHAERWHPRTANNTPTRPAGPPASSSPTRSSFARSNADDAQLSAYADRLRIDELRQSVPDARELARATEERVRARSAGGQPVAVYGSSACVSTRSTDDQSVRPPLSTPPSRSPPKGPRPPPDRPHPYSSSGAWPTADTFERSSTQSYGPQVSPGGFVDPRGPQAQPRPPVYCTPPRPFSSGASIPYARTHTDGPQHPHALPEPPPRFPSPSALVGPSSSQQHPRAQTHSSPTAPASARAAGETQPPLLRPHSDPAAPTSAYHSPITTPRNSTSATPASPGAVKPNQCHGTTGAGKRCTRVVGSSKGPGTPKKNATPSKAAPEHRQSGLSTGALQQLDRRLSIGRGKRQSAGGKARASPNKLQQTTVIEVDSDSDEDFDRPIGRLDRALAEDEDAQLEELPVYCFQHAKQTLEQKGIFIGPVFIDFAQWIPEYLPRDTKLQLRHEISKPVIGDDTPGYIYVHEMASSDVNTSSTTFIKLGRSIKPVARLNQWKLQCRSRSPVVRGIFPQHASQERTATLLQSASPAQVHGALSFAAKGLAHHHRWERLCLIELAGLAAHQSAQRRADTTAQGRCSDCGKIHVELFLVDRGSYESAIRDMVLKWQAFVEMLP